MKARICLLIFCTSSVSATVFDAPFFRVNRPVLELKLKQLEPIRPPMFMLGISMEEINRRYATLGALIKGNNWRPGDKELVTHWLEGLGEYPALLSYFDAAAKVQNFSTMGEYLLELSQYHHLAPVLATLSTAQLNNVQSWYNTAPDNFRVLLDHESGNLALVLEHYEIFQAIDDYTYSLYRITPSMIIATLQRHPWIYTSNLQAPLVLLITLAMSIPRELLGGSRSSQRTYASFQTLMFDYLNTIPEAATSTDIDDLAGMIVAIMTGHQELLSLAVQVHQFTDQTILPLVHLAQNHSDMLADGYGGHFISGFFQLLRMPDCANRIMHGLDRHPDVVMILRILQFSSVYDLEMAMTTPVVFRQWLLNVLLHPDIGQLKPSTCNTHPALVDYLQQVLAPGITLSDELVATLASMLQLLIPTLASQTEGSAIATMLDNSVSNDILADETLQLYIAWEKLNVSKCGCISLRSGIY